MLLADRVSIALKERPNDKLDLRSLLCLSAQKTGAFSECLSRQLRMYLYEDHTSLPTPMLVKIFSAYRKIVAHCNVDIRNKLDNLADLLASRPIEEGLESVDLRSCITTLKGANLRNEKFVRWIFKHTHTVSDSHRYLNTPLRNKLYVHYCLSALSIPLEGLENMNKTWAFLLDEWEFEDLKQLEMPHLCVILVTAALRAEKDHLCFTLFRRILRLLDLTDGEAHLSTRTLLYEALLYLVPKFLHNMSLADLQKAKSLMESIESEVATV